LAVIFTGVIFFTCGLCVLTIAAAII
jgi:hypothetical protein